MLLATAANAGAYIGGSFNTNMNEKFTYDGKSYDGPKVEFFDNIDLAVFLGYKLENGLRLEADFMRSALHRKDVDFADSFDVEFGLGQARALYDIKTNGKFTPYIGVGVDNLLIEKGYRSFDGALVAGLQFALDAKVSLDLQYQLGLGYESKWQNQPGNEWWGDMFSVVKLGLGYKF
jgi:opacity protein-like surface antigen